MVEAMEIPKGFKKTEVGIIPDDWGVKTLGEVLKIRHGKSQKEVADANGEYPILASGGQIGKAKRYLYNKPSVLIGRKGTIDVPQFMDEPFWTVDTLFYSEILEDNEPKFLYYRFLLIDWYSYNEASGVPSLNAKTIEQIQIPLPPTKAEQAAIAEALNDADALITELEKLIAKKQAIKQGAMQELLKPKEGWEVKTIGEIAIVGRGRVISHKEISKSIEGKYPVYSSQTFNNGVMGYLDSYDFDGEYLTWTTDGVYAGKVYHRNGQFNCTNVCGTIKLKKDYAPFVAYLLDTITPDHVSRNLANPKLMNDPMKRIEIPLPNHEEQIHIAQILSDMDNEIEALEKKLDKYKMLKQGMMQNLLTGKIRLI